MADLHFHGVKVGMLVGQNPTTRRKQLWVAAIDASPGASDPSHPAFWLAGQELGNQIYLYLSSVTLADVCERRILGSSRMVFGSHAVEHYLRPVH